MLYGRGAADMKGSLAAMIVAAERFVRSYPEHRGRLAFLITSDEEKPQMVRLRSYNLLMSRDERLDYCSGWTFANHLGDMVKTVVEAQ